MFFEAPTCINNTDNDYQLCLSGKIIKDYVHTSPRMFRIISSRSSVTSVIVCSWVKLRGCVLQQSCSQSCESPGCHPHTWGWSSVSALWWWRSPRHCPPGTQQDWPHHLHPDLWLRSPSILTCWTSFFLPVKIFIISARTSQTINWCQLAIVAYNSRHTMPHGIQ